MKLFGLEFPAPSHDAAVHNVLGATAATVGFAVGSWLLGSPLDRPSAIALFAGFLYITLADSFLAMNDAKGKRYALAASGAGMLVASAAVMEQYLNFS
ncbi:MAG: hypothetical protein H0T52_02010 [Lautropia sp.]|nr:hypothetical protein [Lautropia sp.]